MVELKLIVVKGGAGVVARVRVSREGGVRLNGEGLGGIGCWD